MDDSGDRAPTWQEKYRIAPGTMGMVTYEEAAKALGLSYSRIAALVSAGELHPFKVPRDARNRLRADEIAWYDRKRQGEDAGQNPVLRMQEALAAELQPQGSDTLAELRHYIEQHMAGSDVADHLTTVIAAVAQHIANVLVRDVLGVEPLAAEDRARLSALLAALTQKGRQTP